MNGAEIPDPIFRDAVSAIDSGDVDSLERLLAAQPGLVRQRLDYGEGYFRRPYLLWFVAENPVRSGRLPNNIADVARAIVRAAQGSRIESLGEQVDYALALVSSGRVARECGAQRELIDVLCDAGARPDGAMLPALAHREIDAVERLLERGAPLTLVAAAGTGREDDFSRLLPAATDAERQLSLTAAAFYGRADVLSTLVRTGVDVSAYGPVGFHPHATALHHAVDSGSLAAVRVLVEAGADLAARDRVYDGTPLGWAEHLGRGEIAAYLRTRAQG